MKLNARTFWLTGFLLAGVYIATFAMWWTGCWPGSPIDETWLKDAPKPYVSLHYNRFFYHTDALWEPGFVFMRHIFGWTPVMQVAAHEQTIVYYTKSL